MAAPLAGLAAGPAIRLVLLLVVIYAIVQVDLGAVIDMVIADLISPF